jgi:fatty acid desaturase
MEVERRKPHPARILAHPADAYSVAVVLGMAAMMVSPYFVAMPPGPAAAWIVTAGFLNIAVNLVNHNHTHRRTFGMGWLNRLFEFMLTLTRGSSATYIAMIHNINHHRHEGRDGDWFSCDNQGTGPRPLRPFVYVWRTVRRFRRGMATMRMPRRIRRSILQERIVLNALLLIALVADWRVTLLYVLIPLTFGNAFVVLTNLLHHDGAAVGPSVENAFSYVNSLENWLYLNGGYHAMHHKMPGLHWSELKAAHARHVAPLIPPDRIRGSMFAHLWKAYFRLLPV